MFFIWTNLKKTLKWHFLSTLICKCANSLRCSCTAHSLVFKLKWSKSFCFLTHGRLLFLFFPLYSISSHIPLLELKLPSIHPTPFFNWLNIYASVRAVEVFTSCYTDHRCHTHMHTKTHTHALSLSVFTIQVILWRLSSVPIAGRACTICCHCCYLETVLTALL